MGNRWADRDGVPFINPTDNPFLHITRAPSGSYEYIASVGNQLEIQVGRAQYDGRTLVSVAMAGDLAIGLLPPIDRAPPEPIAVRPHIDEVLGRMFREGQFFALLRQYLDSDVVTVTHGRNWGTYPETRIAAELETAGYTVDPVIRQIGRGKRTPTRCIIYRAR